MKKTTYTKKDKVKLPKKRNNKRRKIVRKSF